jgi:hypothetical protein
MPAPQVLLPRKVETSKIIVKDERKEMRHPGSYSIPFSYGEEGVLIIQTPKMAAPFGIGDAMGNDKSEIKKYSIDLSFHGENANSTDPKIQREAKRMKEFRKCIGELNDKLIDIVYKHPEWVKCKNKKITRGEFVDEYFSNSIRSPTVSEKNKDKDYSDTFKCSIPFDNSTGDKPHYVEFTDSETHEQLSWNDVYGQKFFHAICIIRVTGAWVSPSLRKFGYFIKLAHMQYTPGAQRTLKIQTYDSDESGDEAEAEEEEIESSEDEIDDLE